MKHQEPQYQTLRAKNYGTKHHSTKNTNMKYLQVELSINNPVFIDVFVAEMGVLAYDSFEELPTGLKAYIPVENFEETALKELLERYKSQVEVRIVQVADLEDKNWNEVWESNFEPIMVGDQIVVKAPFHQIPKAFPYTLTIEPKMSFGTGHHATTFLMLQAMLTLDLKDKSVLDFGCGTAILSIMAKKLTAGEVFAIDIEEWAYKNALENVVLNDTSDIKVAQGGHELFRGKAFEVILANINRNVLLNTMEIISEALQTDGILLMSGLLLEDEPLIVETARNFGLKFMSKRAKENWLLLMFTK